MPLKHLYIVRHGFRSNWLPVDQQLPNPTGVDSDPALAPHGVDQANQLADFVSKELDPKPELIFSSPFYRCVETINPIADKLNLDIYLERGIGEWYKRNRGVIPFPVDHKVMSSFFPRVSDDWEWNTVIPSSVGETEEEVFERCRIFWNKFFPKLEEHFPRVETVIIVTHAATKIALGMSLMGYKNNREFLVAEDGGDGKTTCIQAGTCSLDMYSFDPASQKWHLQINGMTSFLKNGTEMNWMYTDSGFEAGSDEDVAARKKLKDKFGPEPLDSDEATVNTEDERRHGLSESGEDSKETTEAGDNDDGKTGSDMEPTVEPDSEYEDVYVSMVFPPSSNQLEQKSDTAGVPKKSTTGDKASEFDDIKANLYSKGTDSLKKIRISGLSKQRPLVQMHNNLYMGDWSKLVGTELVFNENGGFVTKVDSHVVLHSGKLESHKEEKDPLLKRAIDLAREVQQPRKDDDGDIQMS
ncbi:hypothetical protein FOA43_002200 [Brettanomyces nanus]|uniref:Transcription factor TFIIIC triple barrel domain-containing protein n=1 Tax=Eeniella nana TaxID=13502 RepID=A0A875S6Q7_EENNA|nr:uncharacterized protein FOA43_002200 [Brettanomyces nanus]QPG74864.1 hypothetical protein FOA43_002200 [Brettanomyces nanus]